MQIPRVCAAVALVLAAALAEAAAPCDCATPTPNPFWQGTAGAGLSLTGGNSQTHSYSLDFKIRYDPKKRGVFSADGLYLRTSSDGDATLDRAAAGARYEHAVGGGARWYGFGETRYQRDLFKAVDYLISPSVGVGVRVLDRDDLKLGFDAGFGVALEKLDGAESTWNSAVSGGQTFSIALGPTARFVQTTRAIWKTESFGDAYYHFDAGIQAALSGRLELKLGFVDDYKTQPPAGRKKNDTSLLATFLFRI